MLFKNHRGQHIKKLESMGHIIREKNAKICINPDVMLELENFKEGSPGFKVYYGLKSKYGLSTREAGMVYLFYWRSKAFGFAFANHRCYIECLEITERQFYKSRRKLVTKGLIEFNEKGEVIMTASGYDELLLLEWGKSDCPNITV